MLQTDPLTITALALFFIGLTGLLIRRSLVAAMLSLNVAMLGAGLLYCAFAVHRHDVVGLRDAILVMAFTVLLSAVGAAVSIAVFRRRATIHLDELRELRG